ncbi:hypothetical protein HOG17_03140 [Candidatus Peregrinibacteria bacterium]|mgnify:FL=1|jgi:hypothetical protein|nr:hypothetical protein [Candidatus Peregrinibacteria bacterium]MBT4148685.1 hypothetical protein [Candidatus Peregrinibacteria bacterium]MBT4456054.1 hypothetical protein [Candidatus Peregrinibacteria bacterium]
MTDTFKDEGIEGDLLDGDRTEEVNPDLSFDLEAPLHATAIDVADLMEADVEPDDEIKDPTLGDDEADGEVVVPESFMKKLEETSEGWSEEEAAAEHWARQIKSNGGIVDAGRGEITYPHTSVAEVQQASPEVGIEPVLPAEVKAQIAASVDHAISQWAPGATAEGQFAGPFTMKD